ncbi:MAG: peroxidase-related enzyme [Melioribacteraceae bacterium]
MPWIKQVKDKDAEGKLEKTFSKIKKERGKLSNIMKVHSLDPDSMENHLELYNSIMFNKSGLSREEKELVAVVVSALNNCKYCINHHAEALNHYWKDDEKISALISDYKSMEFPIRTHAILNYTEKLTLSPSMVNEFDVQNLRIHDLTDEDILNLNLVISYFNFVNRIATGLGVEFSKDELKGYKY